MDVVLLTSAKRAQVLDVFLAIEEGKHLGKPGLAYLKAKAFRFEPEARTPSRPGLLDIDGELVPFGPIECRAHPAALRVLAL